MFGEERRCLQNIIVARRLQMEREREKLKETLLCRRARSTPTRAWNGRGPSSDRVVGGGRPQQSSGRAAAGAGPAVVFDRFGTTLIRIKC